jgi:uncharacterized protein
MSEPVLLGMPRSRDGEWPTREWAERVTGTLPGWRPVPFRQFVLKIQSRCNLACDYCYMFKKVDQSWLEQPAKGMPRTVVDQAAVRIAEHARGHELSWVEVVLHGGEPLLAGAEFIDYVADTLAKELPDRTELRLAITTNGLRLNDEQILRVLHKHRVRVSVSLDGGRDAHDRHRRYANGRGSYERVTRGIEHLRRDPYRELFARLSAAIDLANDPIATYAALAAFEPPRIDLLLPHGNWADRPPKRTEDESQTPYADWLIAVFDHWYHSPDPRPDIGLFGEILAMLLGGKSHSESIGLSPVALLVIESDGQLQQIATLKASYPGAPQTGLDVFRHSLDLALEHPAIIARQVGAAALCETCQQCPVRDVCGGGFYAHRYQPGTGYLNPSVYSPDLRRLIEHIQAQVERDIARLRAR